MSIQILDFNLENSSKSLLEEMQLNEEDKKLGQDFLFKHEKFLSDEVYESHGITYEEVENGEYDEPFGVLEIDYDSDIERFCKTSVDEKSYYKAFELCEIGLLGLGDCIMLKKGSEENFSFLLNVFFNLEYDVCLRDQNFDVHNKESFVKQIKERQAKGIPVVLNYILYINE